MLIVKCAFSISSWRTKVLLPIRETLQRDDLSSCILSGSIFCPAGTDPATDLRGTGFLGLMHTLYFVMDPETLPLARDIYKLSQHPTQVSPGHNKTHFRKWNCIILTGDQFEVGGNGHEQQS